MARTMALLDSPSTRYYGYEADFGKATTKSSSSPTVTQVALDYLKTSSGVKNMVLKASAVGFDAAALYDPSYAGYKRIASFSKDAKNYSEIGALPNAIGELNGRFWEFLGSGSLESFGGLVRKMSEFLVPFADVTKAVSNQFIPLGSRVLTVVGFTGAASTVLAMSFGIDEELSKIQKASEKLSSEKEGQKEEAEAQITNSYLIIARNLHYAALGSFSIAATLMNTFAPAPLMVALAAGGLFFTIFSHFHTKMALEPARDALKAKLVEA
jgi:hypothetical protein